MKPGKTTHSSKFNTQIIILLLGAIALRLWLSPVDLLPRASAQVPDSGAQRLEILQAIERSNRLLERIDRQLQSGIIQVRVVEGEMKHESKADPKNTEEQK